MSNVLKAVLQQFFAGIAGNFTEPVVNGEKAAAHIDFRDADRCQIIGGVQAVSHLQQFELRLLARRHVFHNAFVADDLPGRIPDSARTERQPDCASVLAVRQSLEVVDGSRLLQNARELLTPRRVNVHLLGDVGDRFD